MVFFEKPSRLKFPKHSRTSGPFMELNDLLLDKKIDPRGAIVFRHRPREPELNKVLPLLAADRPDL
jgi:hypothetical protein